MTNKLTFLGGLLIFCIGLSACFAAVGSYFEFRYRSYTAETSVLQNSCEEHLRNLDLSIIDIGDDHEWQNCKNKLAYRYDSQNQIRDIEFAAFGLAFGVMVFWLLVRLGFWLFTGKANIKYAEK